MNPEDKKAGRFYCNFKVHKEHDHIPSPRPIISGSGSITENIGLFVEHHIKHIATTHDTFIEDTPGFLRCISKLNKGPLLNPHTLLVTWDVIGLFTNIKHSEGLDTLREALEKRKNIKVPTSYLIELMELLLKQNIFEFHESLWKQEVGAAMGSRPIPAYANIFMAKIDALIKVIARKYSEKNCEALTLFKRFLDDYISLFVGTTKNLHKLLDEINSINPSIQLTMNHTSTENESPKDSCNCEKKALNPILRHPIEYYRWQNRCRSLQKKNRSKSILTSKQLPQQDDHSLNTILTELENREDLYKPLK